MTNHPRNALAAGLLGATLVLAAPAMAAGDQDSGTDYEQLKQDWSEAIDTLQGYSARQRDKALAQGRETLTAMDRRLDTLEARAAAQWDQWSQETRQERQAALQALRRQRRELAEWYGGLKHGSDDAWSEVKQGFAAAYRDLADAMGKAIDELDGNDGQ